MFFDVSKPGVQRRADALDVGESLAAEAAAKKERKWGNMGNLGTLRSFAILPLPPALGAEGQNGKASLKARFSKLQSPFQLQEFQGPTSIESIVELVRELSSLLVVPAYLLFVGFKFP